MCPTMQVSWPVLHIGTVPRAYEGMERRKNKNKKNCKIVKCNTNIRLKKNFFFKNQNSTINLPVKWEMYEKSTFLSLLLAKGAVGV
jgi:hypothetical protein